MTQKIAVPTRECLGVDVTTDSGATVSYNARHGIIETDNADHARAIRRKLNCGAQVHSMSRSTVASVSCPVCHFNRYAFTEQCPRCSKQPRSRKSGTDYGSPK